MSALIGESVMCASGMCGEEVEGGEVGGAERGQVRLGVGVVLQRWTGGSWVGPVWSGACQGGPDSPMETWEKDKLVR